MLQKLLGRFGTKVFPYWCPYCPMRYMSESKFHRHYLLCEGRQRAEADRQKALEKIAPVNRDQRRKMAKKAGQIKAWHELNS